KVTVLDPDGDFDYHIYMNNALDHKGYRFFQASYFPDLSGTILSVNHDFWGTWITYIGYTLLYISMILVLLVKGTRFHDLKKKLDKVRAKKSTLTAIALLFGLFTATAQQAEQEHNHEHNHTEHVHNHDHDHSGHTPESANNDQRNLVPHQHSKPTQAQVEKIILDNAIDLVHADKFGALVIQDAGGRMKPLN